MKTIIQCMFTKKSGTTIYTYNEKGLQIQAK